MTSPFQADHEHILAHTADLWEPLRGQRIFVTGGTGFVGTWLLEAFAVANRAHALDAELVVLTRSRERFRERTPHLADDDAFVFVEGDVASFPFPQGECRFVIHAATERWSEPDREHPLGILDADILATRRVLEFATTHGTKRLLFTSSGAAYGPDASRLERVPETYAGAPDSMDARAAYGESKRISEYACASYARVYGFDAMVARLFAFVGPLLPLDEGYAIGNFIGNVLNDQPIAIGGDGTARRSYLYAADLAIWLWTMLLRGEAGRMYNVGSPEAVSIRELADAVAETLAPDTRVTVAKAAMVGTAPQSYVPDTQRAQNELGLKPWIPLRDALIRTHGFYSGS